MHRCIKQKNVSKFHFQIALIQQQFASNDRNTYYEKEGGGVFMSFIWLASSITTAVVLVTPDSQKYATSLISVWTYALFCMLISYSAIHAAILFH